MRMETTEKAAIASFFVSGLLLGIVQGVVSRPMLLAERFYPGAGWVEVLVLAGYSSYVVRFFLDPKQSAVWRRRIWGFFSLAFFAQLGLGLLGLDRFLMSGQLHLPVPAMIVAGPIYRGEGLFMPVLFLTTVLLVGPAWCSFLCYIGAWDSAMAFRRKRPIVLPHWRRWVRFVILFLVVATAAGLRATGVGPGVAVWFGAAFGLVGVGWMVAWSRRVGAMTHCTTWCPMSIFASAFGRLSPFRIRIRDDCTLCGACTLKCRYDALSLEDIKRHRPGFSCTLCGDCLRACKEASIEYRFPGLQPDQARLVFMVLVVSLHATFLGVARL